MSLFLSGDGSAGLLSGRRCCLSSSSSAAKGRKNGPSKGSEPSLSLSLSPSPAEEKRERGKSGSVQRGKEGKGSGRVSIMVSSWVERGRETHSKAEGRGGSIGESERECPGGVLW